MSQQAPSQQVWFPSLQQAPPFGPSQQISPLSQQAPPSVGPSAAGLATIATGPLGRLIQCEHDSQTTHYYYDGVRRLQEITDAGTPTVPHDDLTEHEYVYGPEYVDEFVLQTYRDSGDTQQPLYMLQEANYNVVALLGENGEVLEQYVWQPYGTLVAVDTMASPAPDNRLGHQGLFFYRLDNTSGCALSTGAPGLYHNRNRWYAPNLGRFLQPDPNETGALVLSVLAMNGDALDVLVGLFDPQGHYADGLNLYLYAGANPVMLVDPLGLDVYDDAIADITGSKIAALAYIHQGSSWALLGTQTSVKIAGLLLGVDLFASAGRILQGEGDFWDYLEVGTALAAPAVGHITWKVFKYAKRYRILQKKRALLKANRAAGLSFEAYVLKRFGLTKNTKRITINGRGSVPDVLTAVNVGEIKKGKRICLTRQLRIIADWADANGKKTLLYVSDKAEYISKEVPKRFEVIPVVEP